MVYCKIEYITFITSPANGIAFKCKFILYLITVKYLHTHLHITDIELASFLTNFKK